MIKCDHCGKKLRGQVVMIVPSRLEVDMGAKKIENICLKCAEKEKRQTT